MGDTIVKLAGRVGLGSSHGMASSDEPANTRYHVTISRPCTINHIFQDLLKAVLEVLN